MIETDKSILNKMKIRVNAGNTPIMKNINIKKFLVPASFGKEVYEILYNVNNKTFSCSCKSYKYCELEIKTCKHCKSKEIELNNFRSFYDICSGK